MARYLQKYVGTYRVLAELDKSTNDFPRVKKLVDGQEKMVLDPNYDDLYIPIKGNGKIVHLGGSNLQAYIPSIGRGHNIIKAIYNDIIGNVEALGNDYDTIYKGLTENGIIFDIEDTDTEVLFKFKAKNIEIIAKYLEPKTYGADISPFSTKNLPKTKYDIPLEDLTQYKEITASIPKEQMRLYIDINNGFMETLTSKTLTIDNIKADMKLKGLKSKEYFHSIGEWESYIIYIKNYLKSYFNTQN